MAPENKDKKKRTSEVKTNLNISANNTSHIYLNDKDLKEISRIRTHKKLRYVFLHNNQITSISGIEHLTSLTNLYLQWNKIKKIENLNTLINLEKLYLGFNEIEKLENIEKLTKLKELQLGGQKLPINIEFEFDDKTLEGIGGNLEILNINKLNLKNLNCLTELKKIRTVHAAENNIEFAEDVGSNLKPLINLQRLDLHGCPAQKNDVYYRDKIIAACYRLEYLDEKFITQYNRIFIKELGRIRIDNSNKKERNIVLQSNEHSFEPNIKFNYNETEIKFPENDFFDNKNCDELGYMPWDSLNSVKKKINNRKSQGDQSENDYSMRVKNLTDTLD